MKRILERLAYFAAGLVLICTLGCERRSRFQVVPCKVPSEEGTFTTVLKINTVSGETWIYHSDLVEYPIGTTNMTRRTEGWLAVRELNEAARVKYKSLTKSD